MTLYYAKSTNGFYDSNINSVFPNDAVEITEETHLSLFEAQASGKTITSDSGGNPIAVDPSTLLTLAEAQTIQITTLTNACAATLTAAMSSTKVSNFETYRACCLTLRDTQIGDVNGITDTTSVGIAAVQAIVWTAPTAS